jgi:hypothetical protein
VRAAAGGRSTQFTVPCDAPACAAGRPPPAVPHTHGPPGDCFAVSCAFNHDGPAPPQTGPPAADAVRAARAARSTTFGMTDGALTAAEADADFGWDSRHNRGIYVCEAMAVDPNDPAFMPAAAAGANAPAEAAAAGSGSAAPGGADPVDTALAFKLHSRPGAPRTILLDFTGHTTSGSAWNAAVTGGKPIVTPAYDVDGNPGSFSEQELSNIVSIWRAVAEDYAPFDVGALMKKRAGAGVLAAGAGAHGAAGGGFAGRPPAQLRAQRVRRKRRATRTHTHTHTRTHARAHTHAHAHAHAHKTHPQPQVDVTTEETDAAGKPLDLTDRGTRAVIGGSSGDWLGSSAGGIAYVGVFGNTYYQVRRRPRLK